MAATPVTIRFDPNQQFQLDAIDAVVSLFEGQSTATTSMPLPGAAGAGALFTDTGVGNDVAIDPHAFAANLTAIQDANGIHEDLRQPPREDGPTPFDVTVEMETGTGKTYAYLRTVLELHRTYGLTKFVVVVPSIAIREGVEANLRLLRDHFAQLYDGVQYDAFVYDSESPTQVRGYAQANYPQILIVNIDAFNKRTINLIHRSQDRMMGHAPIEFIRETRPVVILDEPQNMGTSKARDAIASLGPSVLLRYSATHRETPNLIYRLTPVDAYELGLVKRIEVWSVLADNDVNAAHLRCLDVKATSRDVTARVEAMATTDRGTRATTITVGNLTDLQEQTGRDVYAGYVVEEIDARSGRVWFANGVSIEVGQQLGTDRDALQRTQIRTAIREHLEREDQVRRRVEQGLQEPMKVLSLFFIDAVDNYWPTDGKFRLWFEEEYAKAVGRYPKLTLPDPSAAHDGYFARDRKGAAKDSKTGGSKADGDAYELIMQDKDRLLSPDEPLRFIFSHSALREGWDNPNVFTICTLNESISEVRKRQELGRGLRLPVTVDGERCTDPDVARLTVVANESYDDFAAQLQHEIEEETGVRFPGSSIKNGRERRTVGLRSGYAADPDLIGLWERIQHRTRYRVSYDSDELIARAADLLRNSPRVTRPYVRAARVALDLTEDGVQVSDPTNIVAGDVVDHTETIPDLLGELTRRVAVSRAAVAACLVNSDRLGDALINPQDFLDRAVVAIDDALHELLVDGIVYEKLTGPGAVYEMRLFEERELTAYLDNLIEVDKSPFREVAFDSELEREIALALDARPDVRLFLKLPGWFEIDTPVGRYNPDWGVVKTDDDGVDRVYLVRESKPTRELQHLRSEERLKVRFAEQHFSALGVDFDVVDDPTQI